MFIGVNFEYGDILLHADFDFFGNREYSSC